MGRAINDRVRENLARLRALRGLSHEELGRLAGLSATQIRHLETGVVPVDCSCLFRLAETLEAPIASFFEGLSLPVSPETPEMRIDPLGLMEFMSMLKAYNDLAEAQKQKVRDYIQTLSGRA